jgi:hypothetical protein
MWRKRREVRWRKRRGPILGMEQTREFVESGVKRWVQTQTNMGVRHIHKTSVHIIDSAHSVMCSGFRKRSIFIGTVVVTVAHFGLENFLFLDFCLSSVDMFRRGPLKAKTQ